jgi:hypothetical protein
MLYFAWRFAAISWHQGEGSESLTGIPWRYVVKSFMFIGFSITTMAILATLGRLIVYLFGSPDAKHRAHQAMAIFAHEDPASLAMEEARVETERAAHSIRREMRATAKQEREERRNGRNGGGR